MHSCTHAVYAYLCHRLDANPPHCGVVQEAEDSQATADDGAAAATGAADGSSAAAPPEVVPGTQRLGDVVSAAAAAQEKVGAGENRAVEHVAMGEGDLAGNLLSQKPNKRKTRS